MLRAAFLALAFRPFFLIGSLYAAFAVLYWAAFLLALVPLPPYFEPTSWHAHEMIFGFVVAILAGFLLTASRNWAKTRGVHGGSLLFLLSLWALGRAGILASAWLPRPATAVLDLAFLPALAVLLSRTLAKGGRKINFVFVFWLAVLFTGNVLMHLEALRLTEATARVGYLLGVDTMVMLMVLMGGRIIPMFTQNAVPGVAVTRRKSIELLALGSTALYLVADIFDRGMSFTALVAVAAGIANLVRLASWRPLSTRSRPILWILHVGYLFIGLGLIARGASWRLLPVIPSVPIHFLTAGAMGALILGMISRVALGHTGRPIIASPAIVIGYGLVILGALARILVPLFLPAGYTRGMALAGMTWAAGFVIYATVYWPILTRPRLDGLEG